MIYKKHNYSWVSEKLVGDILYQVFRQDDNPKHCILKVGDKITDFDIKDWGEI